MVVRTSAGESRRVSRRRGVCHGRVSAQTGRARHLYPGGMDDLGHPVWDADNHYYEALDAFTRHLDPALGPRTVQWATIDGRQYHVLGGKVSRAVTNATFDPDLEAGVPERVLPRQPQPGEPARAAA